MYFHSIAVFTLSNKCIIGEQKRLHSKTVYNLTNEEQCRNFN